ncbi:Scaffold-type E3 ligase [Hypocenomyce scalaris]|nr:Scaffold-type E3 ligase [Hypocenomyce scalaris]
MGEFSREGFIQGWKTYSADTLAKQQATISQFRRQLSTSPDFFKRVYKHTFLIARTSGQKSVQLDTAIEYWRLLFTSPNISWSTQSTPWLEWWIEYLEARWKKSVNKDMWDQTGIFVAKSLQDESLSWWSEDGAWPGVLDEFVGFVVEKRGEKGGEGEKMEVE